MTFYSYENYLEIRNSNEPLTNWKGVLDQREKVERGSLNDVI
jgi:hypothetical protein